MGACSVSGMSVCVITVIVKGLVSVKDRYRANKESEGNQECYTFDCIEFSDVLLPM
jgi:hypothetical protein